MTPTQANRLLRRLATQQARYDASREERLRLLIQGRDAGLPWADLGEAIGMSAEGARKIVSRGAL